MDGPLTFRERVLGWLLVPVGLMLFLPLALLFVLWFYLNTAYALAEALFRRALGREAVPPSPIPRPHFLDAETEQPADRAGGGRASP